MQTKKQKFHNGTTFTKKLTIPKTLSPDFWNLVTCPCHQKRAMTFHSSPAQLHPDLAIVVSGLLETDAYWHQENSPRTPRMVIWEGCKARNVLKNLLSLWTQHFFNNLTKVLQYKTNLRFKLRVVAQIKSGNVCFVCLTLAAQVPKNISNKQYLRGLKFSQVDTQTIVSVVIIRRNLW